MSAMFWDSLMILLDASIWMVLVYLLRSEPSRISRTGIYVLCAGMSLVMLSVYPFWAQWQGMPLNAASLYSGFVWLTFAPVSFFVFPDSLYKNLFLLCASPIIIVTGSGLGNLAELAFLIGKPFNLLIRIIIDGAMLYTISLITQHQFPGLYKAGYKQIWKQMWVITILLSFTSVFATGYVVTEDTLNNLGFIPGRVCMALVMLAIFYMTGLAYRQAEEVAYAKIEAGEAERMASLKDLEYARIVAGVKETNRMRHDIRQMFTVMQGMNAPGQEQELEAYCKAMLAAMDDNKKEVGRENT